MFPYPTVGDRKNERIEDSLNKERNVLAILFQGVYPYRILLLNSLNFSGTIYHYLLLNFIMAEMY